MVVVDVVKLRRTGLVMAGFADQEGVRLRCAVLTKTRQPELHRASCKPHPNLVTINPVRPSVRRG
jgi:hypothetical protein